MYQGPGHDSYPLLCQGQVLGFMWTLHQVAGGLNGEFLMVSPAEWRWEEKPA
jgi:hypothetical protein